MYIGNVNKSFRDATRNVACQESKDSVVAVAEKPTAKPVESVDGKRGLVAMLFKMIFG